MPYAYIHVGTRFNTVSCKFAFYLDIEMQTAKCCIATATYIVCSSNTTKGSTNYVEAINRFENPIKAADWWSICILERTLQLRTR